MHAKEFNRREATSLSGASTSGWTGVLLGLDTIFRAARISALGGPSP